MLYKYNNEYYILRSRKLSKVRPILTEAGGLTFEHCGIKLSLDECDISRFSEANTEEILKELKKPVKIERKVVEEKPVEEKTVKVTKEFKKII